MELFTFGSYSFTDVNLAQPNGCCSSGNGALGVRKNTSNRGLIIYRGEMLWGRKSIADQLSFLRVGVDGKGRKGGGGGRELLVGHSTLCHTGYIPKGWDLHLIIPIGIASMSIAIKSRRAEMEKVGLI